MEGASGGALTAALGSDSLARAAGAGRGTVSTRGAGALATPCPHAASAKSAAHQRAHGVARRVLVPHGEGLDVEVGA